MRKESALTVAVVAVEVWAYLVTVASAESVAAKDDVEDSKVAKAIMAVAVAIVEAEAEALTVFVVSAVSVAVTASVDCAALGPM